MYTNNDTSTQILMYIMCVRRQKNTSFYDYCNYVHDTTIALARTRIHQFQFEYIAACIQHKTKRKQGRFMIKDRRHSILKISSKHTNRNSKITLHM